MLQRVLLATFSIRLSCHFGSLEPAVFSLRPIWHRVLCEPGRVGHPLSEFRIADFGMRIGQTQREFDTNPKFEIRIPKFYKDPSSFRLNSWRPRASRDFTVPTLIPRVVAISS